MRDLPHLPRASGDTSDNDAAGRSRTAGAARKLLTSRLTVAGDGSRGCDGGRTVPICLCRAIPDLASAAREDELLTGGSAAGSPSGKGQGGDYS